MVVVSFVSHAPFRPLAAVLVAQAVLSAGTPMSRAAESPQREFTPGSVRSATQLPPGRLRASLERLPTPARGRALEVLAGFHFPAADCASMEAGVDGEIFYICAAPGLVPSSGAGGGIASAAAVPIEPFPASLVLHSRPGSANILFLNFCGETVTNTSWNTQIGRSSIPAVPFTLDNDLATFSDAEQLALRRIWQRVAEDYAPFNVDVTTERPSTFTARTAHAVITRKTDANGASNPSSSAGGVGYVSVFGSPSYARYRPVWVYHDNLGNQEASITEASSHEVGHNLGLSHDGKTDGTEYYSGHGSGWTGWGTIMGAAYNRNVTQWSRGEYHLANNTQDDLATIAGKVGYRPDDHANTIAGSTALSVSGLTNVIATGFDTDPNGVNRANKGMIETASDVDCFSFNTGSGSVELTVTPWQVAAGYTRGGNLDVQVALYSQSGALLLTNNPAADTVAQIKTNLPAGTYYLAVSGSAVGNPLSSVPSGYTSYGSIGQYAIGGWIAAGVAGATASAPVLSARWDAAWARFEVALKGSPRQPYVVEASTNLVAWAPVATNMTDAAGTATWTDPDSSQSQRRFYRGRVP